MVTGSCWTGAFSRLLKSLIDMSLINLQMKFGAMRHEHPADQAAEGIVDVTYQRAAPTWRVEEPGTFPRLLISTHN